MVVWDLRCWMPFISMDIGEYWKRRTHLFTYIIRLLYFLSCVKHIKQFIICIINYEQNNYIQCDSSTRRMNFNYYIFYIHIFTLFIFLFDYKQIECYGSMKKGKKMVKTHIYVRRSGIANRRKFKLSNAIKIDESFV